jgi:flagellin-like hook-associated protein FlgL
VVFAVAASPVSNAFSAARAATSAAVTAMATYQDGPSFKTDTAGAIKTSNAQLEVQRLFQEADAAQSAAGLVNVTLTGTEALGALLEDMKGLADSLRDQSITQAHRAILTTEFANLNARFDEMTAAATFAGLNLINPDATDQAGPVTLPSGQQIAAHDLRKGQGTIMPINMPIAAPLLDSLRGAFAFEGNFTREALGTSGLKSVKSFVPVTYSEGEGGGEGINASYTQLDFIPTAGATVSASFQFNQPRNIIQYITSSSVSTAATVSVNSSNNIVVTGYQKTITGPELNVGQWYDISISVSDTGDARVYLDSTFIGDVPTWPKVLPSNRSSVLIYGGANTTDNLSVFSRQLSADEIKDVVEKSQGGVQNWRAAPPNGSDWGVVADDLSQSLANLRNVEAYYGGVARSLDRFVSSQQRLVDAIEVGVKRLVVPDLGKMAARRAAADVHAQVVLATMDTQRGIMNHPVNLLSGAMDAFDRMMVGRFTPSRLGI